MKPTPLMRYTGMKLRTAAELRVLRMIKAKKTGTARPWPGTRGPLVQRVLLPGTDEILRSQPPGRWLQIARKLMLLQGPGEWAGLALVFAAERMAARLGRRPMGAPARTRRGGDSARSS